MQRRQMWGGVVCLLVVTLYGGMALACGIDQVTPNVVFQGDEMQLLIQGFGLGYVGVEGVDFGPGVTVEIVELADPTEDVINDEMVVKVAVSNSASTGPRTISVIGEKETCTKDFALTINPSETVEPPDSGQPQVLLDASDCDYGDFEQDGSSVRTGRFGPVFDGPPFANSLAAAEYNRSGTNTCGLLFSTGQLGSFNFGFWVHSKTTITQVFPGGFVWITFKRAATWQALSNVPSNVRNWARRIKRILQNNDLSDEQKEQKLDEISGKGEDYKDLVDQTGFKPASTEHIKLYFPTIVRRLMIEFRFHMTAFGAAVQQISDLRVTVFPDLPQGENMNDFIEVLEEQVAPGDYEIQIEYVDTPRDGDGGVPPPNGSGNVALDTSNCDYSMFNNQDGASVRTGNFSSAMQQPPFANSLAYDAFLNTDYDPCGLIFSTGRVAGRDLGFWVHSKTNIIQIVPGAYLWIWYERAATWQRLTNVPSNLRNWARRINRVLQNPNLSDDQKRQKLDEIAGKGEKYKDLVDRTGFKKAEKVHLLFHIPATIRLFMLEFRFHMTAFEASATIISNVQVSTLNTPPPGMDVPIQVLPEPGFDDMLSLEIEFIDTPTGTPPPSGGGIPVPFDTDQDCNLFNRFSGVDGGAIRVDRFSSIYDDSPFASSQAESAFLVDGQDPCGLILSTGDIGGLKYGIWVHAEVEILQIIPGGVLWIEFTRPATWKSLASVPSNLRRWGGRINWVLNRSGLSDADKYQELQKISAKGGEYQDLVDRTGFMPGETVWYHFLVPPQVNRIYLQFRFHLEVFEAAAQMITGLRVQSMQSPLPGEGPPIPIPLSAAPRSAQLPAQGGGDAPTIVIEYFDTTGDRDPPVVPIDPTPPGGGSSVEQGSDENNDCNINDVEVRNSVERWITGTPVPGTGGKTIDDRSVLNIISIWVKGEMIAGCTPVQAAAAAQVEVSPGNTLPLALTQAWIAQTGSQFSLSAQGQGIQRVQLEVFDLSGKRVLTKAGAGRQLRFAPLDAGGRRWANGVYLYVVTAHGAGGQTMRSEIKKLALLN